MVKKLRGMKDILFQESEKFNLFLDVAIESAKRYGFEYIETPLLEDTTLFKRSVGESSDIVNKEMYQFIDKGNHDICLRPEGTAGVVRSFIEQKLDRVAGVNRFFYYGAMFRYERPQKGRLREFHQFGVESFKEASVYEDASLILLASDIFKKLNIDFKLKINSLGCLECMPTYRETLLKYLTDIEDGLCGDCKRRKEQNPIRVLDCKIKECQDILKDAPRLLDRLCNCCDSDFKKLKEILTQNSIEFEIDSNLVRGLDYYSKSAFEFVSDRVGSQSAIAGGGRYDKLVEFLGGRETPAVGFAIGIERILDLIELKSSKADGIYFGALSEEFLDSIFKIGNSKRSKEQVYIEYRVKSLKAHLKSANKMGFRECAVIGESEFENREIWVKDLVNSNESKISLDKF